MHLKQAVYMCNVLVASRSERCALSLQLTDLTQYVPLCTVTVNVFMYRGYSVAQLLSSHRDAKLSDLMRLLFSFYMSTVGVVYFNLITAATSRFQWPRCLRRRSTAARLLRLWVRIPPGAWMFVCCECCVLSGRGLCDGLITRPEESY